MAESPVIGSNASSGGGGAPSGAAGGSLTGTYPNPTIATIPSAATATTQSAADNSTKVATTAYADAIAALKANLASPTFTGTPAAPTAAQGTNTTQVATTAMVHSEAVLLAPLASPTFTGTPAAPTAAAATSTTQLATTAMVQAAIAAAAAPLAGTVGGPAKMIRRTTDATNITANTTLASDSQLTFAVTTNADVWFVEAFLVISAANATMDFKVAFAMPTSWTGYFGALSVTNTTTNAWGPNTAATTPITAIAPGTAIAGATNTGNILASYAATIVGDGANTGSIALQIAQNTSDAGALAIKANSFLRATRIA